MDRVIRDIAGGIGNQGPLIGVFDQYPNNGACRCAPKLDTTCPNRSFSASVANLCPVAGTFYLVPVPSLRLLDICWVIFRINSATLQGHGEGEKPRFAGVLRVRALDASSENTVTVGRDSVFGSFSFLGFHFRSIRPREFIARFIADRKTPTIRDKSAGK